MKELVGLLTSAYGPPGNEDEVRAIIQEKVSPFVDEVATDALGNLIATRRGHSKAASVMVVAHMDEPGVIVTHVEDEGFVRFNVVGRVPPHFLLGARVRFSGGFEGVIYAENPDKVKDLEPKKYFIDTGLGTTTGESLKVGGMGVFSGEFQDLGGLWMGKALDDRLGCAVLIEAARELARDPETANHVAFVFSSQSNLGVRGSRTSAYGVSPALGLAVEVVEAQDTPKSERPGVSLGKGVAIKVKDGAVIAHGGVRSLLEETAHKSGIPFQKDVQEKGISDAAGIQLSKAGVPVGALSVPCRYRHTASEAVDPGDVASCSRLLVAVLRGRLGIREQGGLSRA